MRLRLQPTLVLLTGAALIGLTWAVYLPVLPCGFINYDDHEYVLANSHVHVGFTSETLRWAFNAGYACNWHPLTWLSHMLDWRLFGSDPRGHHLVNLLLHLANTFLVFGVLQRMTGALWRSALVAALFALHPAHVQSVAWVAERKDVLSTFFFLLTLGAYACYARGAGGGKPAVDQGRASATRGTQNPTSGLSGQAAPRLRPALCYALALLCFALGLMSKPMLVTVPFVLLLLDYWPLQRLESSAAHAWRKTALQLLVEKAPFFALAVGSSVLTLLAQRRGGAVVPMEVLPLDSRCWNTVVSYLRYAGKLIWPQDFAVIYPYVYHWPPWLLGGAAAFLLGITWAVLRFRRRAPYLSVGWFWYLGTLVPVIGLIQVGEQAMADRYTYIPALGFFLAVVWGVPQLVAQWRLPRLAMTIGAVGALAVCSVVTRFELRHWRDGISLFEHALAVTENNAVAHATLGLALMDAGRLQEAVGQYELALKISPNYSLAHTDMGVALARLARFEEATAHYQSALKLNPKDAQAHFNLANALNPGYVDTYRAAGTATNHQANAQQARAHYQAAVNLFPNYINAHVNWGNLELTEGSPEKAIGHYEEALRIDPLSALAHSNLGNALVKMGKTNEAATSYSKALQIEPDDLPSRLQLAKVLIGQGSFEGAIPHYRHVLQLNPGDFVVWSNLGSCLAKLGAYEQASRCFRDALRLQPDYPDAHLNLGKLLAVEGKRDEALHEFAQALRLGSNNPDLHRQMAFIRMEQGGTEEAITGFSAVTRLRPQDPNSYYELALALVKAGRSEQAVAPFREALRLKPDWVQSMNNLAWLLATHPDPHVRDGAEAVRLATRACELTGYKEALVLGTLDAAYAEAGEFQKAVETAQKTSDLALASGKQELAETAGARLKLYQAGKPYRETRNGASR